MKIQWIALSLSIIGILLNALKIIWCWPIWVASNVCWLIYSYRNKDRSQLILWTVFLITNFYGWWMWMKG